MNPETGLPELPEEDMFWRVEYKSYSDYIFVGEGLKPGVRVSIRQPITTHIPVTRYLFGFIPFGTTTVEKKVEHCLYTLPVCDDKGTYIARYNLTKEDILETAQKVLTNYLSENKSLSLLGDYPPKSLLETENE